MPDLSSLSDEELYSMAGISNPSASNDLSSLSDAELFQIAGVKQPEHVFENDVPSIYDDPIGALTDIDWYFTRPSGQHILKDPLTRPTGEKISLEQAVQAPISRTIDAVGFGLGDEATAAVKAPFTDLSYGEELEKARKYEESFSNASPVVDVGLQVAGAFKNPFVMATKVPQTAGALKKIGQATKEGARIGAAYGFGEGEGDLTNRAVSAAQGGLIGGATSGAVTGVSQGLSGLFKSLSSRSKDAAEETLEKGLGVQYGDRVKGLNRVNLYLDDAGNPVPFDALDDAAQIQAPIQKQIETLKNSGILEKAPNDVQGLKLHITKEGNKIGKQIPLLVKQADEVLGNQELLPDFTKTTELISRYRPAKQQELAKQFNSIVDDYVDSPGSGFSKLTRFTDQLQKETNFDSAIPKEITELKRMIQFDMRKFAEKAFDEARPDLAGQFAKANEIVAATKTIGQTLNKPLSRKPVSFGDYLKGGSLPMTVATGAALPLGAATAATGAGAALAANAVKNYTTAAYPISTSRGLSSLSKLFNALSGKPKLLQSIANPLATINSPDSRDKERTTEQLSSNMGNYQGLDKSVLSSSSSNSAFSPIANQASFQPTSFRSAFNILGDSQIDELGRSGPMEIQKEMEMSVRQLMQKGMSEDEAKAITRDSIRQKYFGDDMGKSREFEDKASQIAERLGVDSNDLLQVIGFETGGSYSPTQKNRAGSGATGLLQFMPSTAKELLNTETEDEAVAILESMTDIEQLDLVEKYLGRYKNKIQNLEDLYMAVLYPKAIGKESDYPLFRKTNNPRGAYNQNIGLDNNEDGIITKAEAASKVKSYKA